MSVQQLDPQDLDQAGAPAADENKLMAERRAKLAAIRQQGIAFPNDFRPEHKAADLTAQYAAKTREELEAAPVAVVLAGRMMLKREAGKKAAFATLQDASGPRADGRIQIYATLDVTGEAAMEALRGYDLVISRSSLTLMVSSSVLVLNSVPVTPRMSPRS